MQWHASENFRDWNGYEFGAADAPGGGHVVRFFYDVTGDPQEELFLHSTSWSDQQWIGYVLEGDGKWKRLPQSIPGLRIFHVRHEDRAITFSNVHADRSSVSVESVTISRDGEMTTSVQIWEGEEAWEVREDGWKGLNVGKIVSVEDYGAEVVTFGELLKNMGQTVWRPVKGVPYGLTSQHHSPEEAPFVRAADILPSDAVKVLAERVGAQAQNRTSSSALEATSGERTLDSESQSPVVSRVDTEPRPQTQALREPGPERGVVSTRFPDQGHISLALWGLVVAVLGGVAIVFLVRRIRRAK